MPDAKPAKSPAPHAKAGRLSEAIGKLLPPAPPAPSVGAGAKVAIHIADAGSGRLVLALAKAREIATHHRSGGTRAAVELVVEAGPGRALGDARSAEGQALRELVADHSGVAVTICDSTAGSARPSAKGSPGATIPRLRHSASCGARLIALKQAGYAYIRP